MAKQASDEHQDPPRIQMDGLLATGLLGVLAVIAGAVAIGFGLLPRLLESPAIGVVTTIVLFVVSAALFVASYFYARPMIVVIDEIDREVEEPERSRHLYGKFLVGIGFVLFVDAILCSASLAALSRASFPGEGGASELDGDEFDAGLLEEMAESSSDIAARLGGIFGDSLQDAVVIITLLAVSTLVAILGALFYFANSMWRRIEDPEREPFDASLFWGGLWFRLGEAVIFNLVLFFLLRSYASDRFFLLPLVALLIGMFLKSGERLIAGIAERMFAAFDALIPPRLPKISPIPKLIVLALARLFENDALTAEGKAIAEAIEGLTGVIRVLVDAEAEVLRIEYDSNRVSRARVFHELRAHGITPED